MKSTITFEPINGYLVRVYDREVESNTKLKYKAVMNVEISEDHAVIKGFCGESWNKRNRDDLYQKLKELGVKTCSYERFDTDGNIRSLHTIKAH